MKVTTIILNLPNSEHRQIMGKSHTTMLPYPVLELRDSRLELALDRFMRSQQNFGRDIR
jgi:hypothetical protein